MGSVVNFINTNEINKYGYKCYDTKKVSLDNPNVSVLYNEIDEQDTAESEKYSKFAETDDKAVGSVEIPRDLIEDDDESIFKYFLDGSRHIFKIADMPIGPQVYPVMAGQIIVCCCKRLSRTEFRTEKVISKLAISLPKKYKGPGKDEDFTKLFKEKLNNYLKNDYYANKVHMSIEDVFLYPTDGPDLDKKNKDRFTRSAMATIQYEMTDAEQRLVQELCNSKPSKLNDESLMIKDGSLQYNPNYSFIGSAEWQRMRANYKYVVGVSKAFNPGLLNDYQGHPLTRTIAELEPRHRTKAYIYWSDLSKDISGRPLPFAVWYVRLRDKPFRTSAFSDVIKCEMIMNKDASKIDSRKIDWISANLIREAYPVCYGKDARWGNHLYPIYLTESLCKVNYIDDNVFMNLF